MDTLVVIDAQEDFTRGALHNEDAIAALPTIREIVDWAEANGMNIVYTRDTHDDYYLETLEGKKLPVKHCIEDTPGQQLCPEVLASQKHFAANKAVVVDKEDFGCDDFMRDSFDNSAVWMLSGADRIYMCGFCTDICVSANFQILRTRFDETPITVFADGCAGVTPELHEAALKVMQSCQADIVNWSDFKKENA